MSETKMHVNHIPFDPFSPTQACPLLALMDKLSVRQPSHLDPLLLVKIKKDCLVKKNINNEFRNDTP